MSTKEKNRPFAEVLQYFGIERFLYRFSCSILRGLPLECLSMVIPKISIIWLRNSSDPIGLPLKVTELLTWDACPIYFIYFEINKVGCFSLKLKSSIMFFAKIFSVFLSSFFCVPYLI